MLLDYLRPIITNPIPSHPVHPQSLFYILKRPWIDPSRPPMTSNDYQWLSMTTNDYQWLTMTTNDYQWLNSAKSIHKNSLKLCYQRLCGRFCRCCSVLSSGGPSSGLYQLQCVFVIVVLLSLYPFTRPFFSGCHWQWRLFGGHKVQGKVPDYCDNSYLRCHSSKRC